MRTAKKQAKTKPADIFANQSQQLERQSPSAIHRQDADSTYVPTSRAPFSFGEIPLFSASSPTLQPKLKINAPGDKYEREADRIAEQVIQTTDVGIKPGGAKTNQIQPKPLATKISPVVQQKSEKAELEEEEDLLQTKPNINLQRKCAKCQEEEKKQTVQTKAAGRTPRSASPSLSSRIQSTRGRGQAMDSATHSFMSSRFGADFSQVRIHTDTAAVQMNREINAQAFTVGKDVYFNQGKYNPGSVNGKRLLAHELTHVVQQSRSSELQLQRYGHDVATCKGKDLKSHIWPGDRLARIMVASALANLSVRPVPKKVKRTLKYLFKTTRPSDLREIRRVFGVLSETFARSDYFYTCLETCSSGKTQTLGKTKVSSLFGGSGPIVLCMNNLRKFKPWLTAETIIHEFCHRYLHFPDDYYDTAKATREEALKNPASYAEFAREMYNYRLIKRLPEAKPQERPSPAPAPHANPNVPPPPVKRRRRRRKKSVRKRGPFTEICKTKENAYAVLPPAKPGGKDRRITLDEDTSVKVKKKTNAKLKDRTPTRWYRIKILEGKWRNQTGLIQIQEKYLKVETCKRK